MKFVLRFGDQERTVRVLRQGDRVRIQLGDDEPVLLRTNRLPDGTFELWPVADDAQRPLHRLRAAATRLASGGRRQLWADGQTYDYERHEGGTPRASAAAGALSATIPSVVLEVLVAPGDRVEDGQKLVLLESMKMVLPIQAPHAGTVQAVLCQEGESVEPGRPLVEIEPTS